MGEHAAVSGKTYNVVKNYLTGIEDGMGLMLGRVAKLEYEKEAPNHLLSAEANGLDTKLEEQYQELTSTLSGEHLRLLEELYETFELLRAVEHPDWFKSGFRSGYRFYEETK